MLRFALKPTIFPLDKEDDITPPTSPILEIQRNLHGTSIPEVIPETTTSVQAEFQDAPRHSTRLASGRPAKSPKSKSKALKGHSTKRNGQMHSR